MKIQQITENKAAFMTLLTLADDEKFIADYLEKGDMWTLDELAVAIVTDEGDFFELQNLAVLASAQGQGYGSQMLEFLSEKYPKLHVRTDEYTAVFYEKSGFTAYKTVKNYFPEKYGHQVFDRGYEIKDNIYLRKE
ncbi:GNAT family N-acetyltransferase [Lactococcus nasutitermitis]|uniref:GNAT family N-acetyltransferase n=1 Tax=Lactococcus nasutitermitis TaxID=1652957 RepID=A0ABV9J9G4_9LACT|nr:GNAT family N-acetyltransferase [Lactococcus nasutitermitis]